MQIMCRITPLNEGVMQILIWLNTLNEGVMQILIKIIALSQKAEWIALSNFYNLGKTRMQ
jgi:hypothetical protein